MKWAYGALFCFLAVAVSGCGKPESNATSDSKTGDASAASTSSPATPNAAEAASTALSAHIEKRSSLEGRWVLLFYQRFFGAEVPAAVLEIGKSGERLTLKNCKFTSNLTNPSLKAQDVTPNSVHLIIEMTVEAASPGQQQPVHQTKQVDVLVEFRGGYARGDAQFTPVDNFLVALVPTKLDRVDELHPQQLPEAADLGKAGKDTKPEEVFKKSAEFVATHPKSSLTLEIYPFIFKTAADRKWDAATIRTNAETFYADAALWGARAAFKARMDVIGNLVAANYMHDVVIQQIDETISKLNEETRMWKGDLEAMRGTVITNRALTQIQKGSAAEQAKAAEALRHHEKAQPYDPVVMYELARYDAGQGRKEAALEAYSQIAVLPMFGQILHDLWTNEKIQNTPAREAAIDLWKDLHKGKAEGFDEYLDGVYAKSMPQFKGKRVQPRPQDPDNRVVLCELFTGTDCPPCVAADVAFSELLKTYDPSEVIALQYHEHSPRPDPLANEDTEGRLRFYFADHGSTPTFAISGSPMNAGGLLHQTPMVYRTVRQAVDHFLSRKTSVHIRLKAEPKGSAVAVTADVEGSFPLQDPIRLRFVLAEEQVRVHGSNGIREHEMVVRAMPGGVPGIEIKDAKLHYPITIDLKSIRQQLDDYLTAYEQSQKMAFPKKPMDLSHLHLVAFVQNDRTYEVYQAATVPFPSSGSSTTASVSPAGESQKAESRKAVTQEARAH